MRKMPSQLSRSFFERAIMNLHVNITMSILDIWCTIYNLKEKNNVRTTLQNSCLLLSSLSMWHFYLVIFFLLLGNVFGFCLHKNARSPRMYRSKYISQSICVTSNWNVLRSVWLICVSNSRTLSSVKRHWCVVKYSKHPTAFFNLFWIFTILQSNNTVNWITLKWKNFILWRMWMAYIGFFPSDHANRSRK